MHNVDLGIWVHMLLCAAVVYDKTLRTDRILTPSQVEAVWDRLAAYAQSIDPDDSMIKLNKYKGNYLKSLLLHHTDPETNKLKKAQAWEHHLLMNV